MKRHLSGWIQPFAFKDAQRGELLRVLPRRSAKDKDAANRFIEAARRDVEIWLSLDIQLFTTTPSKHKEKLARLINGARELRAALDDIPADTGASLHANVYTTLYCEPYKRKYLPIGLKLKLLGIHDPCDDNFLEELLEMLEESASRMASNYDVRRGADTGQMISLTAKLADRYGVCFQKKPTAGNNSNFRNFMAELSKILGYEFGAQTVKDAIERVEEVRKLYAKLSTE